MVPATNQRFLFYQGASPTVMVISSHKSPPIVSLCYIVFTHMQKNIISEYGRPEGGTSCVRAPSGAPWERSCNHDGSIDGIRFHQDFSIDFSHTALYVRNIHLSWLHLLQSTVRTPGIGIDAIHTRIWALWGSY